MAVRLVSLAALQNFSEFCRSWSLAGPASCGSESTGSDRGRVVSRKARLEEGSLTAALLCATEGGGALQRRRRAERPREAASRRKARLAEGGHGPALKVGAALGGRLDPQRQATAGWRPTCSDP